MTATFLGLLIMMTTPDTSALQATTQAEVDAAAQHESDASEWEFSLSAYTYIIEDDQDYVQTTFTADYNWLHLEARHQYEDLDTVSLWVGYNLSFSSPDSNDDGFTLDFTPMIGGVFGDTDGIAPGYEVTFGWREFELYTEGEYVFDGHHSGDDFFYSWTELTYSFNDWLRAGGALQRTKIRREDTEFEVGPMVGVTWNVLDFSAFLLYPEEGGPSVVLGLGIEF